MRYIFDNDLHIHSYISLCSKDEAQTPEAILEYARENGLKTIALTDHFWDTSVSGASGFYQSQNFEWISRSKPLPQCEGIDFIFGCEADMDKDLRLGIPKERFDDFDFVVMALTHLHMVGFTITEENAATAEGRARAWIERLEYFLGLDLPFHKIGLAHLATHLLAKGREMYLNILELLPDEKLYEIFSKCARLGVGIELNASDMSFSDEEADTVLKMFRIAKECGCKFYMGSDAHHPAGLKNAKAIFERAIDLLGLTEDDKYQLKRI